MSNLLRGYVARPDYWRSGSKPGHWPGAHRHSHAYSDSDEKKRNDKSERTRRWVASPLRGASRERGIRRIWNRPNAVTVQGMADRPLGILSRSTFGRRFILVVADT
jgi:hypothetical protein